MKAGAGLLIVCACGGVLGTSPDASPNEDASVDAATCEGVGRRVIAAETAETHALAIDHADLYWTEYRNHGEVGGDVMHGTVDGDAPTRIATDQDLPVATATDPLHVLWVSSHATGIFYVPKAGPFGGETAFGAAVPSLHPAFAVGGYLIYFSDGQSVQSTQLGASASYTTWVGAGATGFALEPYALYFRTSASIVHVDLVTRLSDVLAPAGGDGDRLVLDDAYVYWPTVGVDGTGSISRVEKTGGAPTLVASGLAQPTSLAVDDQNVYFATTSSSVGGIARVPKSGGDVEVLASCLDAPVELVIDSTSVYFTSGTSVYALPK